MNIELVKWKNIQGIRLENELVQIVVLPSLGGKIASMIYKEKGFEMASQHIGEYIIPNVDTEYVKSDVTGIDDTFPNINKGVITINDRVLDYSDHGEIWRSTFNYRIDGTKLILTYESKEHMYRYEKIITLEGYSVVINYRIDNMIEKELPCIWTMHGLVRYEEDMQLIYPKGVNKILNVHESKELGVNLKEYNFKDEIYDFNKVPNRESNTSIKYYVMGEVEEGECGYLYPTQKVKCILNFEREKLPYLGFWISVGGFRGDYSCAFEPSNGFYDGMEIAVNNKKYYVLKQNETLTFNVSYTFSDI